ncbi:MAG: sulfite exporter TauE/SafE family protein [Desulfobacterales bacterium]
MDSLDVVSMFMLGFLGSGHCVGMCGPLVFSFPGQTGKVLPHIGYHMGRITTYICIGAVIGSIRTGITTITGTTDGAHGPGLLPVQFGLLGVSAICLFLLGLVRLGVLREPKGFGWVTPDRFPGYRKIAASAMADKTARAMFLLGLIFGFLPCGLSFAAFARALPAGGIVQGGLLILAFGLGTVPALLLMGTGASALFRRFRKQSDILSGLLMLYMATLLTYRLASIMP